MPVTLSKDLIIASAYLSKVDPVLKPVIEQGGLPKFEPHNNYYFELVESIISQQLSVKAANSIKIKFLNLLITKHLFT